MRLKILLISIVNPIRDKLTQTMFDVISSNR